MSGRAAGEPNARSQMVTSTQCIGCHSSGGTGLQFDMTEPGPDNKMVNVSPYGTWRTSPKGLAGRDPIFFAQLASETETFHPEVPAGDRGHLPRLPCGAGPAPVRRRPPRRHRHVRAVRARQSECDSVPGRRRGPRARALCGAGARRRLLHHLPQHGARQGGHRRRAIAAAERLHRRAAGTDQSGPHAGWRGPSPAISCSARPASSTDRSAIPSRSR